MKKSHSLILSLVLALPLSGYAADEPEKKPGTDTRALLELQKSGKAASPDTSSQQVQGEVADQAYKRYVDSFAHPLPVTFPRQAIGGQGK